MYKKRHNSLAILIPSFKEKKNFKNLLFKLNKNYKILVIDDSSNDGTSQFLKKNKIKFIRNNKNLGYEKSLIKGFLYTLKIKKIKYILTMDADGQHNPVYIDKLMKYLSKNNSDIIIGSRIKKNRFIEIIISLIFKKKYGLIDPLSGFKLYKKEVFKKIGLQNNRNVFLVDLILESIKKGLKIKNYNIKTNLRKDKSRVGNFIKANTKMLKILSYIFFYK